MYAPKKNNLWIFQENVYHSWVTDPTQSFYPSANAFICGVTPITEKLEASSFLSQLWFPSFRLEIFCLRFKKKRMRFQIIISFVLCPRDLFTFVICHSFFLYFS